MLWLVVQGFGALLATEPTMFLFQLPGGAPAIGGLGVDYDLRLIRVQLYNPTTPQPAAAGGPPAQPLEQQNSLGVVRVYERRSIHRRRSIGSAPSLRALSLMMNLPSAVVPEAPIIRLTRHRAQYSQLIKRLRINAYGSR